MVEHVWTVVCESSAKDTENVNVSLFDVLGSLEITGKGERGVLRLQAHGMSSWARSDPQVGCRANSRLIFCLPSERTADSSLQPVELMDRPRQITRSAVDKVPVKVRESVSAVRHQA